MGERTKGPTTKRAASGAAAPAAETNRIAGWRWTRATALIVTACSTVWIVLLWVVEANDIETNIDTGDQRVNALFFTTQLIGSSAALLCLCAGVDQLAFRGRTQHVFRWWALMVISAAVVFLAGMLLET